MEIYIYSPCQNPPALQARNCQLCLPILMFITTTKKKLFSAENSSCSLDDSLTNMQWLFNLDSNPLQEGKKREDPPSDNESMRPMNPYPKPPFSYASLILLAINSTLEKRMTLQSIYQWIENNFPYYKHCKKAWKVISL